MLGLDCGQTYRERSPFVPGVKNVIICTTRFPNPSEMSGIDGSVDEINGTEVNSESFLRFSPTTVSTGAATVSYSRTANVYVYISIFLSLLLFLLSLLIIALHRLKNIISSSSTYPECSSEAGSSFTNMEICSISSQRSTVSSLSC
ncbi:serine rich and transmembrane domain containing 1 isoform X2 [Triplophysa dalaica]|uniref:serine rich and transmembrane domain containing 1 isoform X2 n=1 Tax=Triplophysa dalaica TaxID=1582913 RepID=UPI0024DFD222|nr:serine rich and transmembrane domain containing 1 isoform X2 [Triplophysa dalaica]